MAAMKVTAGQLAIYTPTARAFTMRSKDGLFATLDLGDTGSFPVPGGPFPPGSVIDISGTIAGDQTLRRRRYGPTILALPSRPQAHDVFVAFLQATPQLQSLRFDWTACQ